MKLLIVEDDIKIADFITTGFKRHGFTTDVCHNGIDGLHLLLTEKYDAVVLDIMLPEIDGLTILEKIRACSITTPIIILSAKKSVEQRIQGLNKGADDYLSKPFSFLELLARVDALTRRSSQVIESKIMTYGDIKLDIVKHEAKRNDELVTLQPKEFALLHLMMKNPDKIISKTIILESIWDYNFDPKTNVVDVLVCRLRNKIDKGYDTKYVHTLRGIGYVFKKSDQD